MTPQQIAALADEFSMVERLGSPFGSPHYVHDADGAELELIVSRGNLHISLLFEAECMDHLNYNAGLPLDTWTEETARRKLLQLRHRRTRLEDISIASIELESAA